MQGEARAHHSESVVGGAGIRVGRAPHWETQPAVSAKHQVDGGDEKGEEWRFKSAN